MGLSPGHTWPVSRWGCGGDNGEGTVWKQEGVLVPSSSEARRRGVRRKEAGWITEGQEAT